MKLVLFLSLQAATALLLPASRLRTATAQVSSRQAQMSLDRRSALGVLAALPAAFVSTAPAVAATDKVVIFGGSGYVGAHAAQMLLGQGAEVVSVSRKSPAEQVAPTRTRTKGCAYCASSRCAPLRWRSRAPIPTLVCATSPEAANLGRSHLPYAKPCCRCPCPCTPSLPLPLPLYP